MGQEEQEDYTKAEKEKMIAEQAKAEAKRMTDLLTEAGVSETRIKLLESVIENTAYLKIQLDITKEAIKNSKVVIPYDNGGGQTGLRENPLFKGYESLFKSYMSGINRIFTYLPADVQEEKEELKPQNVLQLVRSKHGKAE